MHDKDHSRSWQDFEKSVAEIFRSFRFHVIHDLNLRGGQTDVLARSRSPHRISVVAEVKYHADPADKVGIRDVDPFVQRVSRLRSDGVVDRGYLITNTTFTADARAAVTGTPAESFTFLETYDSLLRQLVDLRDYHDEFVETYERRAGSSPFVPLDAIDSTHAGSTLFDGDVGEFFPIADKRVIHMVVDAAGIEGLDRARALVRESSGRRSVQRTALQLAKPAAGPAAGPATIDDPIAHVVRRMVEAFSEDELRDMGVSAADLWNLAAVDPPGFALIAWADKQSKVVRHRLAPFRRELFATEVVRKHETRVPDRNRLHLGALDSYLRTIRSNEWEHVVLHERMDAIEWLKQALSDAGPSLSVLLGDFGAGKTTIVNRLTYELIAKGRDSIEAVHRLPMLINLKDYNKVPDLRTLLTKALAEFTGGSLVSLSLFKTLNRAGFFVLVLDGFDEMLARVTRADRRRCFLELAEFLGGRSKVVISGRPGFFPDQRELEQTFEALGSAVAREGETLSYSIACVQLLDEGRVEELLIGYAPDIGKRLPDLLRKQPGLRDLARRPVLAVMVAQTAGELLKLSKEPITARRLYEIYTNRWITIEEDKGAFRLLLDPAKKATFIRYLAMQMHLADDLRIHFSQLAKEVTEHFELREADEIDHFDSDIRTCSFLRRDDTGYYEFIHKSFMEFFVTLEFERLEESPFAKRFKKPLGQEMVAFLDPAKLPPHFGQLLDGTLVEELKEHLDDVNSRKEQAVRDQDFEVASGLRNLEREIQGGIRALVGTAFSSMKRKTGEEEVQAALALLESARAQVKGPRPRQRDRKA
jgi:hypothetical protein